MSLMLHPNVTAIEWQDSERTFTLNSAGFAGGSIYLTGDPGDVDISSALIENSDSTVAVVEYNNKYYDDITEHWYIVYSVDCSSPGTITVTAKVGEATDSCTIIVEAYSPPPEATAIAFDDDVPQELGPYNQPSGHYEGTIIVTPEGGDVSEMTITSSHPQMVEATLGLMDKTHVEIGTTPFAVNGTEVTITINCGNLSDSVTLTINDGSTPAPSYDDVTSMEWEDDPSYDEDYVTIQLEFSEQDGSMLLDGGYYAQLIVEPTNIDTSSINITTELDLHEYELTDDGSYIDSITLESSQVENNQLILTYKIVFSENYVTDNIHGAYGTITATAGNITETCGLLISFY